MPQKNVEITVNNVKFDSLSAASEYFHITQSIIKDRLKSGMTPEEAVGVPKKLNLTENSRKSPPKKVTSVDEKNPASQFSAHPVKINGESFGSISAFARHYGLVPDKVRSRMHRGESPKDIIQTLSPSTLTNQEPAAEPIKGIHITHTSNTKKFKVDGAAFGSISELATHFHTDANLIKKRLSDGWSVPQSVGVASHPSQAQLPLSTYNLDVDGKHFHTVADVAKFTHVDPAELISLLHQGLSCQESVTKLRSVTVDGKTYHSERDAAQHAGVPLSTFYQRRKRGMSVADALMKADPKETRGAKGIPFNGAHFNSLRELARSQSVSPHKLRYRVQKQQMSIADAIASLTVKTPDTVIDTTTPRVASAKTSAQVVRFRNKTYPSISAFAIAFKQKPNTVITRLNKGWSRAESVCLVKRTKPAPTIMAQRNPTPTVEVPQVALSKPPRNVANKGTSVRYRGETYPSIKAFADAVGVSAVKARRQLNMGLTLAKIAQSDTPATPSAVTKTPIQTHSVDGRDLVIIKDIMPVKVQGKEFHSAAELARHYNMNAPRVTGRLKNGWTPEQAVEIDIAGKKPRSMSSPVLIVKKRTFSNVKELALHYNLSYRKVQYRLNQGATPKQAVELEPWKASQHKGKPVSFGDVTYPSFKALIDALSLDYNLVMGRFHAGWTLEEAISGEKQIGSIAKKSKNIKVKSRRTHQMQPIPSKYSSGAASLLPEMDKPVLLGNLRFEDVTDFAQHLALDPVVTERRLSGGWSPHQIAGLEPPPNWR
jgi:hypothetical protein